MGNYCNHLLPKWDGETSQIQYNNGRFQLTRWIALNFSHHVDVRYKRRVARAEKVVSEQWKVIGMQMRNDANLEKDNTGRETSSANSTTSTITKQTSLCAAALQGVAHPSDGSPELLDDHDCKIALSDHHQFTIALNLVSP